MARKNRKKPVTPKRVPTAYGIELTKKGLGNVPVEYDPPFRVYYHQDPNVSKAYDGKLWQLPDPSKRVLPRKLLGAFAEHPIEIRYYKDLELICKYWECREQDILPPGLCKTTPYSQAMLALLRRIAGSSRGGKNGMEQAHGTLLMAVATRLKGEIHGNLSMTVLTVPPPKLEHTTKKGIRTRTLEGMIIERRDGLMFQDAEAVRAVLQAGKRAEKKEKKEKKMRRMAAKETLLVHPHRAEEMAPKIKEEPDESDSGMAPEIKEESDVSDSGGVDLP